MNANEEWIRYLENACIEKHTGLCSKIGLPSDHIKINSGYHLSNVAYLILSEGALSVHITYHSLMKDVMHKR